mgnify:CR=1 FL=1
MSGAAGLSAAKRRRAGSAPTNQSEQRRMQVPPSQNRRYTQSAYNQYRQQTVNQVQPNRENTTQGERINFSILLKDLNTRVKRIEENFDIKKQVIPEENNVKDEAYNLLLSEISNIKTLIMNLQSAYVVQNKKMEEYCKCQENKLNQQETDLISENIEFNKKVTPSEVKKVLEGAEGCKVIDETIDGGYATPIDAEGKNETFISRIREDKSNKNSINLWIVSDNLLRGAALNAVEIAETYYNKN